VKRIYTTITSPYYVPLVVAFAAGALVLVGADGLVVLDAPLVPPVPVPATVACTIWPNELKMILTNALSGLYEYCFCTCPPGSAVSTPVYVMFVK
jgi:hypothetical protein